MPLVLGAGSPAESFRFVLRRETRTEHARLDENPIFAALLDGTLDIEGYQALMRALHGLYAHLDSPLRDACDRHAAKRSGFVYAPRTPILARDLDSLGVKPALPDPNGQTTPPIETYAALGGALYVVEGSVLGGSMLCKAAEALLEKAGAGGNFYWQWCRQAGPGRWAMTCLLLDELATTEERRGEMIDGARAAFRYFGRWLDGRRDVAMVESSAPC